MSGAALQWLARQRRRAGKCQRAATARRKARRDHRHLETADQRLVGTPAALGPGGWPGTWAARPGSGQHLNAIFGAAPSGARPLRPRGGGVTLGHGRHASTACRQASPDRRAPRGGAPARFHRDGTAGDGRAPVAGRRGSSRLKIWRFALLTRQRADLVVATRGEPDEIQTETLSPPGLMPIVGAVCYGRPAFDVLAGPVGRQGRPGKFPGRPAHCAWLRAARSLRIASAYVSATVRMSSKGS